MTANEILQLAQSLNERDEPYAMVTVVRVAATNVSVLLGDGSTNFVSVTQGQGTFIIIPGATPGTPPSSIQSR